MDLRSSTLLDEALGLGDQAGTSALSGRIVAVEDCVETSGAFVLHHLMKRALAPVSSNVVIFLAFSHPFSHYDRVLHGNGTKVPEVGFIALYGKILKAICALPEVQRKTVTIFIDDLSLMEVSANGFSNNVLDFLHYCHTLTSEVDCSLVLLNHMDVYSSAERPTVMLQTEYLADILIKAEPLATGLASDVHGQLTVLNKGINHGQRSLRNFHFKVKENTVEYFYPGTRH